MVHNIQLPSCERKDWIHFIDYPLCGLAEGATTPRLGDRSDGTHDTGHPGPTFLHILMWWWLWVCCQQSTSDSSLSPSASLLCQFCVEIQYISKPVTQSIPAVLPYFGLSINFFISFLHTFVFYLLPSLRSTLLLLLSSHPLLSNCFPKQSLILNFKNFYTKLYPLSNYSFINSFTCLYQDL